MDSRHLSHHRAGSISGRGDPTVARLPMGIHRVADPTRRPVSLHPLEVTGPEAWTHVLPVLRKAFPNWRFGEGIAG